MKTAGSLLVASLVFLLHAARVSAFAPAPAEFWWLNTFLQNQTIGRYEPPSVESMTGYGPCPDFARRCTVDLATLPESVKRIGVNLPSPFNSSISLGQALPSGKVSIWRVEMNNAEIKSTTVTGTSLSSSSEKIVVKVTGFKANVNMALTFSDLAGFVSIHQVEAHVNKATQTNGTEINFELYVQTPAGKSLATSFPNNVTMGTCNIKLDLQLSVSDVFTIYPFSNAQADIANIIIGFAEPLLGNAVCGVLRQLFTTFDGSDGFVNVLVNKAYNAVGNLTNKVQPTLQGEEANLVAKLTTEQKNSAINLGQSTVVRGASVVLNNWLGAGGPGNPVVNEVVNLLTTPNNGSTTFSNLEKFGLSIPLRTPIAKVVVNVSTLSVSGLNSFSNIYGFQLIKNNYDNALPRLNYTLDNKLSLDYIKISLLANLSLFTNYTTNSPPGWIYTRPPLGLAQTRFSLNYTVALKDLDIALAFSLISDPSKLKTVSIGQLLGKQDPTYTALEQLIVGGKCASPSIFGAGIPNFTLGLGDIITPVFSMSPVDVGITQIVDDVTKLVLTILESATTSQLPLISQFWVRPLVNDFVSSFFVAGGAEADCPTYESLGKTSLNLRDSIIFGVLKDTIRNAIGGDPVRPTLASINELLKQLVLFLCEAFASPTTCSLQAPGQWRFSPAIALYPGQSFSPGLSFIGLNEIDMKGVNSINKLLLDNVPGTLQGINFILELGLPSNPFQLVLKNHWKVDYPGGGKPDVDELFDLQITLTGLKINATILPDFDLDQLYLLKVEDLFKSACLLAPFASLKFELALSSSSFGVALNRSIGSTNPPVNALRTALQSVINEQGGYTSATTTMFNFVLQSVGRLLSRQLTGRNNSVVNALTCASQPNLFDTFIFRVAIAALSANLTDVFAKATGPQPAVPSPDDLDASLGVLFGYNVYNFKDSAVISIINNVVGGVSQSSLQELLQTLGNRTGDILSDNFVTENDGSVSLDINFLRYGFFKDGFDMSLFVENGTFFLNRLRVTKIDSVDMSSIRILKPLSKYVLDTYISIPAQMKVLLSFGMLLPKSLKGETGPNVLTTFNVTLDVDDLEIALQTLTAIDRDRLTGLALGNFISVDSNQTFSFNLNAITCLLRLFVPGGLSIPKLMIAVSSLGTPTITVSSNEFVSQGLISTLNAMLDIVADFYVQDLGDVTQGGLRVLLNTFLIEPNLENPGTCENPTIPPLYGDARYLNFQKSSTVGVINSLTRTIFAGDDGTYVLFNTVLGAAFDNRVFFKSSVDEIGFTNFRLVYKKRLLGTLSFYVRDISLVGLGTFRSLNILQALSSTRVANNMSISGPLEVNFGLKWSTNDIFLADNGDGVGDELEFTLTLTNLTIGTDLNAAADIPELLAVQYGSLTNFSQIACVFSAFQNFSVSSFVLDVAKVATSMRCAGICESPLFAGISNGLPVTSENNKIADYIPTVIEIVVNLLNSYFSDKSSNSFISDADRSCALSLNLTTVYAVLNPEKSAEFNVTIIFALGLLGIGCGFLLLAPLAVPRHYQLKDKMLAHNLLAANSVPGANSHSVAKYMAKQERDQIAIAFHPAITPCCKCFVPVMALVNILLLALSFVVYLSFSIDLRLFILGSETNLYTFVPWTVQSTINDFWNAGAWPLSILVIFASCAWPVVKNMALFTIWFAPKTFLNHRLRYWLLVQLDVLGKWSFLDAYIINILVGALRFTLAVSNAPLLQFVTIPDSLLVLEAVLTPGIGILILVIAALMSLIVNHIIVWELAKAEYSDRRLFKQIDGVIDDMLTPKANIRLSISEYVFSTTGPSGQRDRYGPKAKNSVILMLGFAMILLVVGYCVPFVSFTYDGVLGFILGFFVLNGRQRTFSLITIGTALPEASIGTTYQNLLFLFFAVVYFATIIVAPMVQMLLHVVLWLKPLSLKDAQTVLFFAKIAAYWAALEVFSVGIVATSIEVKPVTFFLLDFITGNTCAALKPTFVDNFGEKNGACLIPGAVLAWGFPIAVLANLFQIGCGAVMIRASGVAIRDREDVLERRPHTQWSYLEYLVLDRLLVHGAAHHNPRNNPNREISYFERVALNCSANPASTCANCGSAVCKKLDCCSNLCSGVQDVSLTTPITADANKVTNSKWNAPPSASGASSKWNPGPSQGAPRSANPSWSGMRSVTNSSAVQQHRMVANNSLNLDSPNPVYFREQENRRNSIEV